MKLRDLCFGLLMIPSAMFAVNLSGTYNVNGYDPTSTPPEYVGSVVISTFAAAAVAPGTHPEDYYTIEWTYTDFQSISGIGVRKDDFIAFDFTGEEDPTYNGVQLYQIKEDCNEHGRHSLILKGPWIVQGGNEIGLEQLTKVHHQTID